MRYTMKPAFFALIGVVLISCATMAPLPGTEGKGLARVTSFSIVKADNDFAEVPAIVCVIDEGSDMGRITGILPGGTKPLIGVRWSVKRGSLWADGVRLSPQAAFDISKVKTLQAVDSKGLIRNYSVDIREASMPTVYIETENAAPIISKADWVKGKISMTPGAASATMSLDRAAMKVRGRGNSTWEMPKKPYRFTLDEAAPLFGLPKAKKWVLLANYADKSLMRNFVALKVALALDGLKFPVHQFPVIVYLNGDYQGIYGLGEQVEVASGRVAIEKPDASLATSFFVEVNMRIDTPVEGGILDKDFFMTPSGLKVEFKTPDTDEVSDIQRKNISTFVADAEKAILSGKDYGKFIDVNSFIDWVILEELFKNPDSRFISSVYLYRPKGGRLALGPAWDFDLSSGNSDYDGAGGHALRDSAGWFALTSEWFAGLCGDAGFRQALASRWTARRNELEARTMAAISEYSAQLSEAEADNFRKWQIMGIYVWPNPPELVAAASHEAQVGALKNWISARFAWMDEAMAKLAAQ